MTHVTCRLTAKNRDQLRNPTLGNRVWATFTLPLRVRSAVQRHQSAERPILRQISSLMYPKIQRRQVIMNVLHLRCAPGRGLQKRLIRSRFGVWTRGTRQLCPGFPMRRGNLGTGHLLAHCGVQRISGVNQSHSVGGSNDADFRCAYCRDLLCYN